MVAKTMHDLMCKELPKLPFYIESGVLPKNGLMLLAGPTKIGKSFVIKSLMRDLAEARPLFGQNEFWIPEKVRSLYVENEIGEYGLQDRVLKSYGDMAAADLENMYYISKEDAHKMKLDDPLGTDGYGAWTSVIRDVAPQVLIIDPIAAFHTSDENDTIAVEKLYARIAQLQAVNPWQAMSVIIVHHTGKQNRAYRPQGMEWDPLDAYNARGSSKFPDRPDSLFTLNKLGPITGVEHKAWELEGRFVCRRSASPEDFILGVNEKDDGRVRFRRWKTGYATLVLDKTRGPIEKKGTSENTQLSFAKFDPA